jgi:hypothetical protein
MPTGGHAIAAGARQAVRDNGAEREPSVGHEPGNLTLPKAALFRSRLAGAS